MIDLPPSAFESAFRGICFAQAEHEFDLLVALDVALEVASQGIQSLSADR
jgi:hypothetical protein